MVQDAIRPPSVKSTLRLRSNPERGGSVECVTVTYFGGSCLLHWVVLTIRQLKASLMKSAAVLNLTLLAAMQCTAATAQQVSNNPLNPAVTLDFHNYYYPPTSGPVSVDGNALWLRGMVSAMIFDTPQSFPVFHAVHRGADGNPCPIHEAAA